MADNRIQRSQHEQGDKHKQNVERVLGDMYRDNEAKRLEEFKLGEELRKINEAAERAHYRDMYPNSSAKRARSEPNYGTYDNYGGWYDGHGHYYTYKNEAWEYVGFFPQKDYVPGMTAENQDEAPRKAVEAGINADASKEDAEKPVLEANELGQWEEVRREERTSPQKRESAKIIRIKLKDVKEKRPGAEDSADEEEAEACGRAEDTDWNKGELGDTDKPSDEQVSAPKVTFRKVTKRKPRVRQREN
eukprot:CAMPEP_0198726306 /NCGR_PEP_ID=MMETSP1475-20131203/3399_1 /TAXON_ID= ORGANISM="Unidentified sp., Strain CCMP1999" /NCGR_SAMPLE_ID=MMETSP1475 /ASSEMBLY_ACC=CAM_ASM_001111 /LENGTH=246 /DNA_ID=CAMNT_0044488213 /DNA_START=1 /DNA_END=741 /DNA_ORIENTATION=-